MPVCSSDIALQVHITSIKKSRGFSTSFILKWNENFFRAFPNCRFGNKCLFIHPNCKYDAKCKNPACSFMHSNPRVGGLTAPAAPSFAPPRKWNSYISLYKWNYVFILSLRFGPKIVEGSIHRLMWSQACFFRAALVLRPQFWKIGKAKPTQSTRPALSLSRNCVISEQKMELLMDFFCSKA